MEQKTLIKQYVNFRKHIPSSKPYWKTKACIVCTIILLLPGCTEHSDWGHDNQMLMITWKCYSMYANSCSSILRKALWGGIGAVTKHIWKRRVNRGYYSAHMATQGLNVKCFSWKISWQPYKMAINIWFCYPISGTSGEWFWAHFVCVCVFFFPWLLSCL